MQATLLIKAKSEYDATKAVTEHCKLHVRFKDETLSLRLEAWILYVEIEDLEVVNIYKWFNDAPSVAPYPAGTLLWFQVTP